MRYILLFALVFNSFSLFAQRTCGAHHLHEKAMANDPMYRQKSEEIEEFTKRFIEKKATLRAAADEELIIPVVFHVVYKTDDQNISDTRLKEQIKILNDDFNALNSDISKVPEPFKLSVGMFKVKFVLANRDTKGNITTGINRYKTTVNAFSIDSEGIKSASKGGANAWDPNSYLNIWVGNIYDEAEGDLLGYASFPSNAGKSTDGVALHYHHVGKTGSLRPYNLGRTATHEFGHYFNLYHIWGDADRCTADDGIGDTPSQYTSSSGVPTFPKTDQCTKDYPGIMFMNFMDYSNDEALLMFTNMQADRMLAALNGPRASLLKSKGYVPTIDLDVSASAITSPEAIECYNEITPKVVVYVDGAKEVSSLEIAMKIDNGTPLVGTWTGKLVQDDAIQLAFSPITVSEGNHTITFTINKVNGVVDDNTTNNSVSKSFTIGVTKKNLPLVEDFESANLVNKGITILNEDGKITWLRSKKNVSSEGSYSLYMNNYDYDPEYYATTLGQYDDIIFPFLDLSNEVGVEMTFDVAAAAYTDPNANSKRDSLQVLVSTDCGNTYDILYNKYGKNLITVDTAVKTAFNPVSSQWRSETINLDKYAGNDLVRVIIRNISQWQNNIFVDNVKINNRVITAIHDQVVDNDIVLYPNPSDGQVTLRMNKDISGLKNISWINALGQEVLSQTVSMPSPIMNFDLSKQPKGIYIIKLEFVDGTVSTQKLILD